MTPLASIASSGLRAAQLQMNTSAHNVANLNTPRFQRQSVALQAEPTGGVSAAVRTTGNGAAQLHEEAVAQMSATYSFRAQLQVLRTADQTLGRLLDERA